MNMPAIGRWNLNFPSCSSFLFYVQGCLFVLFFLEPVIRAIATGTRLTGDRSLFGLIKLYIHNPIAVSSIYFRAAYRNELMLKRVAMSIQVFLIVILLIGGLFPDNEVGPEHDRILRRQHIFTWYLAFTTLIGYIVTETEIWRENIRLQRDEEAGYENIEQDDNERPLPPQGRFPSRRGAVSGVLSSQQSTTPLNGEQVVATQLDPDWTIQSNGTITPNKRSRIPSSNTPNNHNNPNEARLHNTATEQESYRRKIDERIWERRGAISGASGKPSNQDQTHPRPFGHEVFVERKGEPGWVLDRVELVDCVETGETRREGECEERTEESGKRKMD